MLKKKEKVERLLLAEAIWVSFHVTTPEQKKIGKQEIEMSTPRYARCEARNAKEIMMDVLKRLSVQTHP
jgi:hypothetical protein